MEAFKVEMEEIPSEIYKNRDEILTLLSKKEEYSEKCDEIETKIRMDISTIKNVEGKLAYTNDIARNAEAEYRLSKHAEYIKHDKLRHDTTISIKMAKNKIEFLQNKLRVFEILARMNE